MLLEASAVLLQTTSLTLQAHLVSRGTTWPARRICCVRGLVCHSSTAGLTSTPLYSGARRWIAASDVSGRWSGGLWLRVSLPSAGTAGSDLRFRFTWNAASPGGIRIEPSGAVGLRPVGYVYPFSAAYCAAVRAWMRCSTCPRPGHPALRSSSVGLPAPLDSKRRTCCCACRSVVRRGPWITRPVYRC